ncbi:hypothetical protein EDC04DRAFT_1620830 [Pisolithus marmoratus]|nr:hypothetical protein EDC04DRAFT_1620830 [Pisolithus marmoratus]
MSCVRPLYQGFERSKSTVAHMLHTAASGHSIHKGRAIEVKIVGTMVHALQGKRPNLVASRWNFASFQAITAEAKWSDEKRSDEAEIISRTFHVSPVHDADTGYNQPICLGLPVDGLVIARKFSRESFCHCEG